MIKEMSQLEYVDYRFEVNSLPEHIKLYYVVGMYLIPIPFNLNTVIVWN